MTQEEYIDFDIEVCTSYPEINSDEVDWKVSSVNKCVREYLNKEAGNEKNQNQTQKAKKKFRRSTLSSLKDRLEVVRIKNKKQLSIFLSNQSNDLLRLIMFLFLFSDVNFIYVSIFYLSFLERFTKSGLLR